MDNYIITFGKEIYENEKHPLAVKKLLAVKGMTEEEATNAIATVRTQERNKHIADSKKNMTLGIVLIDFLVLNSIGFKSKGLFFGCIAAVGSGIALYSRGKKYDSKKV
jgi:hypothetical protein